MLKPDQQQKDGDSDRQDCGADAWLRGSNRVTITLPASAIRSRASPVFYHGKIPRESVTPTAFQYFVHMSTGLSPVEVRAPRSNRSAADRRDLTNIIKKLTNNLLASCREWNTLNELLMFLAALAQRHRGRIWDLQKTLSICVLVAIAVLVCQAGDLSVDARDFIQGRLQELRIVLQPS